MEAMAASEKERGGEGMNKGNGNRSGKAGMSFKEVWRCTALFFLILALISGALPMASVRAETMEDSYPYTIFAGSEMDDSITVDADNFCVNGNIAANGGIIVSGNSNMNGLRTEYADLDMVYIFNKIDAACFSDDNVEHYEEDYSLEEQNINIENPLAVEGETTLTGNININTAVKSLGTLSLYGEVKNAEASVIVSKYGDIVIDSPNVNLNGLIYAPFGTVIITAQNLSLNHVVIIADRVMFHSPNVNAGYSDTAGAFVGSASEPLNIPYEEWSYMEDDNQNGLPDLFEDLSNWSILEDTDQDSLPDVIEYWLGSDPTSQDTDGDGLEDFHELFICLTDLTLSDTDGNGIMDGDEDFDGDHLTTLEEHILGSHPLFADTDGDGLDDYYELKVSATDPNTKDTEQDGAEDQWELDHGYDPREYNDRFHVTAEAEGEDIQASVSMDVTGSMLQSLSVRPADDLILFDETVPGYMGSPFEFRIEGEFEQAEISFTFDPGYVDEENILPTIYYWNEETQLLEELPTTVEENTASAITTHFSVYVLLNKTTYDAAWQTIRVPNSGTDIQEMNIAFAVDVSGSMRGAKIGTAKKVIQNFVSRMRTNPVQTNVSLVSFSTSATLVSEMTDNYDDFMKKVEGLRADGLTSIYSGLDQAMDTLEGKQGDTSSYDIVILLTDGYDKPPTTYEIYQPYIDEAVSRGIQIYSIGIGTIDEELLIRLSDETGGNYYFADDAAMLYEIYEAIGTEIIDYTTDSNEDGICDYYTRLLCDGTLRIATQSNLFADISYEKVQSNNDYDGDGLLNGEEMEIIQDEETGRVYVYLHSNPFQRDSDSDGMEDGKDDAPMLNSTGFLIYQTKDIATDTYLKNCSFAERPEDYQYADKSIEQLQAMEYVNWMDFFGHDKQDYVYTWKSLVKLTSQGEMEVVALDMVNHFMDGTATDYYNPILTQNAEDYEASDRYVNGVTDIVNTYIESHNGNISGLAYINGTDEEREKGVLVDGMDKRNLFEPVYDDTFGGLQICVDSLYGNRIEMTSYSLDGNDYEYTLRFTLYDIYGLDSADIEHIEKIKDDKVVERPGFGIFGGFRSWYILQHCNLYGGRHQPFITYIVFEKTVRGTID